MPTGYTPIYRIEKSGLDITARFNDRATQIKIDLQAGDSKQDTIHDRDWAIAPAVLRRNARRIWARKKSDLPS